MPPLESYLEFRAIGLVSCLAQNRGARPIGVPSVSRWLRLGIVGRRAGQRWSWERALQRLPEFLKPLLYGLQARRLIRRVVSNRPSRRARLARTLGAIFVEWARRIVRVDGAKRTPAVEWTQRVVDVEKIHGIPHFRYPRYIDTRHAKVACALALGCTTNWRGCVACLCRPRSVANRVALGYACLAQTGSRWHILR